MSDRNGSSKSLETSAETRRRFIERLAKVAAIPAVQPLLMTISTAALAS